MRFGSQVGLSPRFSLSISSTRSDVPKPGVQGLDPTSLIGRAWPSSRLSGRSPSHRSVLILSSEAFLASETTFTGEVECRVAGFVGGVSWPPAKSSWKMGILELWKSLPPSSSAHGEKIGVLSRQLKK